MSGKIQLEVVGVFGTIHIKQVLGYKYFKGTLSIEVGNDGTYLGHKHKYLFKEWYYIRVITK